MGAQLGVRLYSAEWGGERIVTLEYGDEMFHVGKGKTEMKAIDSWFSEPKEDSRH